LADTQSFESAGIGGPVNRVLIYRLGSLGDTVVVLPCLHLIARVFPNARRIMLTNSPVHAKAPATASVIGSSGLVHDYITYQTGSRSLAGFARIWWKIREFSPDILIYLAAPRGDKAIQRDLSFFRLCGIRTMIGAPVGELAEPLYDAQTGLWEHEAFRLARTLAPLGNVDLENSESWDLRLTPAEINTASRVLAGLNGKQFLVAAIGTKMQAKDWGTEKWQALMQRLGEVFPDHAMVFLGARDDFATCEKARSKWQGEALNLCGMLTPRESAAVIQRAELLMGPDSGPMHVAAALGVPCAAVFAARARPGHWFPFGKGHQVIYHKTDCFNCNLETCIEQRKKCIESVQVDEMLNAAVKAWEYGRRKREMQLA